MAGDQRAGRRHADEDRAGPGADRGARLLAERGVRLVADHDRVGARDVAGVAHEPLVGLDGDRAVGAVLVPEQRRRDALLVAAVAQLADELVDEVAPVREDQHAAGARRLDEAERGDGLAGAGRMLEPEALGGVGVLGLLGELLLVLRAPRRPPRPSPRAAPRPRRGRARPRARRPRPRPLRRRRRPRPPGRGRSPRRPRRRRRAPARPRRSPPPRSPAPRAARRRRRRVLLVLDAEDRGAGEYVDAPLPLPIRSSPRPAARSACPRGRRPGGPRACVPSASLGSSSERTRSRPSSSENSRRQAVEGIFSPASSSASAWSSARRRGVPGASATAGSSPGCTNGSRVNASARAMSSSLGRAIAATVVGSAIEALCCKEAESLASSGRLGG